MFPAQRYKDVRELRAIFEEHGAISDVNIPVNQATQQSRGFAFVEFKRSSQADACVPPSPAPHGTPPGLPAPSGAQNFKTPTY